MDNHPFSKKSRAPQGQAAGPLSPVPACFAGSEKLIAVQTTVLISMAKTLFTAMVIPSKYMPARERKTAPWQARTMHESFPAQPCSPQRP